MFTLTGSYAPADQTPAAGWVDVVPDVVAVAGNVTIVQKPVRAVLDGAGSFTLDVIASDDPSWKLEAGQRMPYIIRESVDGLERGWMTYLDGTGGDIANLVPLVEAPDMTQYLTEAEGDARYQPLGSGGWDPLFVYVKAQDLECTTDWMDALELSIVDAPAGTYMFGVSFTWTYNTISQSLQARFSQDDGQTWGPIYSWEPKDTSDRVPFVYTFPQPHDGGTRQTLMQVRKTSQSGTAEILYLDMWYQRVA